MNESLSIIHVVTRVSEGGASGGPTAVAHALIRQLSIQGQRLKLFSGFDGKVEKPQGIDTEYFKTIHSSRLNFSSVTSPLLFIRLARRARTTDVAHVHLARDFVTLPAAMLLMAMKVPVVIQTHGMIRRDNRLPVRVLDAVFTKPIMRKSALHLVLTPEEEAQVTELEPNRSNITRLTNGIAPSLLRAKWTTNNPEVLFCARLHSRKRALEFIEMARIMVANGTKARFTIVGPDEGELTAINEALAKNDAGGAIKYEGQIEPNEVTKRISQAQVYVLPSINEPFPVTVLEALSGGVPCVITNSNGIAPKLSEIVPQSVCDGTPNELAKSVSFFLEDESQWTDSSKKSVTLIETEFSLQHVTEELTDIYRSTTKR